MAIFYLCVTTVSPRNR